MCLWTNTFNSKKKNVNIQVLFLKEIEINVCKEFWRYCINPMASTYKTQYTPGGHLFVLVKNAL